MIDFITSQNAHMYRDLLSQMFQLRYRVFKEQLGWDVQGDNGEERDEFDRLDTAYLIASNDSGRVTGAWRLLPTTKPYMASTVFRELFDDHEPPCSSAVWECSRFVVEPYKRHSSSTVNGIDDTTSSLIVAITEFAITYNIHEIVSVETPIVARLHQRIRGRKASWRGSIHRLGDSAALVAQYDINGPLLWNLREKYQTPAPIIRQLALWDQPDAA